MRVTDPARGRVANLGGDFRFNGGVTVSGIGNWVGVAVLTLLGIIGLYVSANTHDGGLYIPGLLLAGFAVLMLFRLIAISISGDRGNL